MAYIKILNIASARHVSTAANYIENADKTEQCEFVTGYACEPCTAASDFLETKLLAQRHGRRPNKNVKPHEAYHIIQSFAPGEVTPEQAHEIGQKLANEFLGGRFEYVIATHIDKNHVHNHILVNSVSFYDYKKLYTAPYKTIEQLRQISNRLSIENDLSVIQTPHKLGYSYKEWSERQNGTSWKSEIRKRLNFILARATSYEEFVQYCADLKIFFNDTGKQTQFRLPGQERNIRGDTLDKKSGRYSVAGIKEQCQRNLDKCSGQPERHDIVAEWENQERKDYSFDAIPVPVPEQMIEKMGESGLLLRTNLNQRIFLSNHLLDYDEEQKRYVFHVQLNRNYPLSPEHPDPDLRLADQQSKQTVQGEILLTQMAQYNGVPVRVYLASVENLPAVQIQRRIIAVERSATRARVHQLNDILWTLKHEGIEQCGDFDLALNGLREKAAEIQNRITAAEDKQAQYQQVAKWLNTVQTYQELSEQRNTVSPWRRKKFELTHQTELDAYDHASERLQHYGISDELESEQVIAIADQQRQLVKDFSQEKKRVEERIIKLKVAQEEVVNRRNEQKQMREIEL
jgi:hypothetical protein